MSATDTPQARARLVAGATSIALAVTLLVPTAAFAVTPNSSRQAAQTQLAAQKRAEAARKAAAARAAAARKAAARRAALRRQGYITRAEAVARGKSWVRKKVQYSQSRYYQGYRTDCSGFVSMSWKAKTSYCTANISSASKRIAARDLKPGDAVLWPGHVVLFVKWTNKRAGQFLAYEESNSKNDARAHVKSLSRPGAKPIRYKKIIDN